MKKLMIVVIVAAATLGAFAGPRGCPGGGRGPGGCRPCSPGWGHRPCGPGWGRCPPPPPPPPHHHGCWGRGGRDFWPGFVGGVVGGLAYNAVATPCYRETVVVQSAPTVITQPVVVQQPVVVSQPVVTTPVVQAQGVWIEGRYVDQVQSNGMIVRVWVPGHYE